MGFRCSQAPAWEQFVPGVPLPGRLLAGSEADRFARSHGYTKIVIQVLAHNDGALRFYRSLGFREIGAAKQHVRLAGNFYDEVFLEMPL